MLFVYYCLRFDEPPLSNRHDKDGEGQTVYDGRLPYHLMCGGSVNSVNVPGGHVVKRTRFPGITTICQGIIRNVTS